MFFRSEQKEQYKKFMFDCFGNSIVPQTQKIFNRLKGKIIKSEYIDLYTSLLEKYSIPYKVRNTGDHIYFGNLTNLDSKQKSTFNMFYSDHGPDYYIQKGQIGICYLEQYTENDTKRKNIYDKILEEFFWDNREAEEVGWHSCSVGNTNEFLFEEIRFSYRYCYFVVDKMYKEDVKNIASYVLGYDVEFNHIEIINEELGING
ncbi:hypothetical protein [Metabacillus rhizolycopersici]|uniref:Uncharacterized protein n=1 Tax=Metabacillus rhizolycopersici TaxID=2875709 RepID=A0ABS7V0N1_9BACI|nr:hypothetical protein [Metabacillus rhizolycopersici]MBZ5753729.1 hypothetical protein [Metabacillus rhizolycopersici]